METIRKPHILLTYNGHSVTADFSPYVMSVNYTDFTEGQSDELEINLRDNKDLFKNSWYIEKGAKLACEIGFEGKPDYLDCGTFRVDENTLTSDESGDIFCVKALATGYNKSVRTAKTVPYNNKTLIQIAEEKGKKLGFEVAKDAGNIAVGHQVQHNETDLAFLKRIANMYGYTFKITNNLLVFIPFDSLTAKKSLFVLDKSSIKSLQLSDTSVKQYSSCCAKYFDPRTKKLKTVTVPKISPPQQGKAASDILKINTRCNSLEQARALAVQGLKKGSVAVTGNITLKEPRLNFIAGVNFTLKEYGIFDGKYHIKQSNHRIDANGWEVTGEIEKC